MPVLKKPSVLSHLVWAFHDLSLVTALMLSLPLSPGPLHLTTVVSLLQVAFVSVTPNFWTALPQMSTELPLSLLPSIIFLLRPPLDTLCKITTLSSYPHTPSYLPCFIVGIWLTINTLYIQLIYFDYYKAPLLQILFGTLLYPSPLNSGRHKIGSPKITDEWMKGTSDNKKSYLLGRKVGRTYLR